LAQDKLIEHVEREHGSGEQEEELRKHELQFHRKQQLIEFYKKHEPSKLADVDTILAKYKFVDVVASLNKKYGTVPLGWDVELAPVPIAVGSRLTSWWSSSSSAQAAPKTATDAATLARRKRQLTTFYQIRDPSKVSEVDTILTQYKFLDVVASLQKKYGKVPEGWDKEDTVLGLVTDVTSKSTNAFADSFMSVLGGGSPTRPSPSNRLRRSQEGEDGGDVRTSLRIVYLRGTLVKDKTQSTEELVEQSISELKHSVWYTVCIEEAGHSWQLHKHFVDFEALYEASSEHCEGRNIEFPDADDEEGDSYSFLSGAASSSAMSIMQKKLRIDRWQSGLLLFMQQFVGSTMTDETKMAIYSFLEVNKQRHEAMEQQQEQQQQQQQQQQQEEPANENEQKQAAEVGAQAAEITLPPTDAGAGFGDLSLSAADSPVAEKSKSSNQSTLHPAASATSTNAVPTIGADSAISPSAACSPHLSSPRVGLSLSVGGMSRGGGFVCPECRIDFPHSQALLIHSIQQHGGEGFICPSCTIPFPTAVDLLDHAEAEHSATIKGEGFLCPQCRKGFKSPDDLLSHTAAAHAKDGFICPQCKEEFASVSEVLLHSKVCLTLHLLSNAPAKMPPVEREPAKTVDVMLAEETEEQLTEAEGGDDDEMVVVEEVVEEEEEEEKEKVVEEANEEVDEATLQWMKKKRLREEKAKELEKQRLEKEKRDLEEAEMEEQRRKEQEVADEFEERRLEEEDRRLEEEDWDRKEAEEKARMETEVAEAAEARVARVCAQEEADRKEQEEAEEQARKEAEEKARREEEQARKEAEEKARREAEQARKEAEEEQARKEGAEEQARKEAAE
jgi:hypothetical protein